MKVNPRQWNIPISHSPAHDVTPPVRTPVDLLWLRLIRVRSVLRPLLWLVEEMRAPQRHAATRDPLAQRDSAAWPLASTQQEPGWEGRCDPMRAAGSSYGRTGTLKAAVTSPLVNSVSSWDRSNTHKSWGWPKRWVDVNRCSRWGCAPSLRGSRDRYGCWRFTASARIDSFPGAILAALPVHCRCGRWSMCLCNDREFMRKLRETRGSDTPPMTSLTFSTSFCSQLVPSTVASQCKSCGCNQGEAVITGSDLKSIRKWYFLFLVQHLFWCLPNDVINSLAAMLNYNYRWPSHEYTRNDWQYEVGLLRCSRY